MKKSKKSSDAFGGNLRLRTSGSIWEAPRGALGGSEGALGELWEALYITKLPINRPADVMLRIIIIIIIMMDA